MKHRVLVVEDNLANRELLCDWLEAEEFDVRSAENLEQAYGAFDVEPPNVVLLDVQLGSEDGLALAKWIRREPKTRHIPVIAVSAHAMLIDQERMIQAGCSACISKPLDFKLLSEQLQRWLAHPADLQSRM
jgi:CheY-like chemotaxis protein